MLAMVLNLEQYKENWDKWRELTSFNTWQKLNGNKISKLTQKMIDIDVDS